ncbi:hypothetical protein CDL15_Pgr024159 [Punica granatum]|uniref:TIR domain-containing protein n=1 Tax=Punica granatum TaxID=22663 RepID=A0A218XY39_PUNGR|nr:hypothetical protein CDL15_Pgr024159 [Punica granatum]
MEEEETRRGEQIAAAVLDAIKGSRFLIVVFSRNYMTSSRCLDELASIVECSESKGKTIIPVFYRVEPLDLRERKGDLGRAMEVFEERFKDDMEKVRKWRDAVLRTSNIFGWKFDRGYESEIVEKIAQDVSGRVGRTLLYTTEPPTGMDSLLNELKSLLDELCDHNDDALQHIGFPHDEIRQIYKANFDAMGHHEKAIFLDIASFFSGENKDNVVKVLSNCNLYPDIGIPLLVDKSLVHIKGNKLSINDLVQHMGRAIVRQESPNPGNRSRLWFHEDVLRVLEGNTGTDAIEGMLVNIPRANERVLNAKAFANMKRLRLLIIKNACFSSGPKHLPNELRWLEWNNYPSPSLPSDFRPKKLTMLRLHSGSITQLWDRFKMCLNLAIVELTKCDSLCEIPNVSAIPNLEKLIVKHCTSLVSVHESVGFLEKLVVLSFEGCSNLRRVPAKLRLVSLETLDLSGCSNLEKFPDISARMESVESIDISCTAVKELPSSIENLTGLRYIKLNSCKNLKALPTNIYSLQKIKDLYLKGCTRLQEFPMYKSSLAKIETGFPLLESFDASTCGISNLNFLEAPNCFTKLQYLNLSRNNLVTLPSCISKFSELKFLHLEDCKQLREMPELPPNLTYLNAKGCKSLERLHMRNLWSTAKFKLNFSNCHKLSETQLTENLLHEASFTDNEFQVIIPGSGIPYWLSYRSSDNSMCFEVQSCVREKLVGLIVSTAFCLKDTALVILKCNVSINGETVVSSGTNLDKLLELDHMWLGYFPLFQSLEEIRDGWNQVEVSLKFLEGEDKESSMVKVKGFGVHFLGELDKEKANGSAVRVLFPEICSCLKGRAANMSFDSMEDVQLSRTKGLDDHKVHIWEGEHILRPNSSQDIPNAAIPKQNRNLAGNFISISTDLLPKKLKKNPCYLRRRKWLIGLGPRLIFFKITMRKKKRRNEKKKERK